VTCPAKYWADEFPAEHARGGFDVIVGNPPYIRIQNMQAFHQRKSPSINQQPDPAETCDCNTLLITCVTQARAARGKENARYSAPPSSTQVAIRNSEYVNSACRRLNAALASRYPLPPNTIATFAYVVVGSGGRCAAATGVGPPGRPGHGQPACTGDVMVTFTMRTAENAVNTITRHLAGSSTADLVRTACGG
jgi:hypothetical protein